MATSRILFASFLVLSLLLLNLVHADDVESTQATGANSQPQGPRKKIDCGAACAARCQLASRHKMCLRACGTCCARCSCVPPGTSGNRDVCPCYATMTTHGGRLKCP